MGNQPQGGSETMRAEARQFARLVITAMATGGLLAHGYAPSSHDVLARVAVGIADAVLARLEAPAPHAAPPEPGVQVIDDGGAD